MSSNCLYGCIRGIGRFDCLDRGIFDIIIWKFLKVKTEIGINAGGVIVKLVLGRLLRLLSPPGS